MRERRLAWSPAWLAVVYPLVLASAPGRMPSDSKLYLYLDPAGWLGRATTTWDTSQFAGFVPHQQIAYVWPAGPWFWAADVLGLPDWVAHRLWIGTLLVAAGWGVLWLARLLGLPRPAAFASAAVYMLSPYVLAYVSRTSVMLLPWAGLGWILGLVLLAARSGGWRHPALCALVVVTVGSTNATALAMIVPAPLVLLVHLVATDGLPLRRAVQAAARTGAACLATSLWWIAMLLVQGRFGADVLSYTETLEAVSSTSTAPETVRGLGYWLNYVRDHVQATTNAAADYHTHLWLIGLGFVLVVAGATGIALSSWRHRAFAASTLLVGMVLAVGAYPINRPAPLFAGFGANSRSTIALALRSSTRALPMSLLALALGVGALVATVRVDRRRLAAAGVVVLAVLNLPSLWLGRLVDRDLERTQDVPAAWRDAAAALDAAGGPYRVWQLPAAEFGAFRWGYTVDPPQPGIARRPFLARDLQPLGSAAAMDLLYALDDRFQLGIVDPSAIAPVARLLGVDTIWVAGDMAFERFRTPRPALTEALYRSPVAGLDSPTAFGSPTVNVPSVPMIDEQSVGDPAATGPVAPVLLVPVDDPVGIVRVKATTVVVSGSGDGIVDAAAAGLLDGQEAVLYSASLDSTELTEALGRAALVVVTDSNRDRAHHWRGSQDVVGFTEDGLPGADSGRFDSQDQRLPVFTELSREQRTYAVQDGPVTARASSYGSPLAYWPEYRAVMAVDGDPSTAWRVGADADPRGEWVELTSASPMSTIQLSQPPGDRRITAIDVEVPYGSVQRVDLAPDGPTVVSLPTGTVSVRLTIRAVTGGHDPVGFSEISSGQAPTREIVVVPIDAARQVTDQPFAVVLTRERVRATDRRRSDPEPNLVRRIELGATQRLTPEVTVRLDPRADDAVLGGLLGAPHATASSSLAGSLAHRPWAAVDGDPGTAWIGAFGDGPGTTLEATPAPDATTAVVVQTGRSDLARITRVRLTRDGRSVEAHLAGVRTEVDLPPGAGPLVVTVVATDGATTIDRATGRPVALPVGIAELQADGLSTPLPAEVDTGCRDDLLTVDGTAVALRATSPAADALAGAALTVERCDPDALVLPTGAHLVESGRDTGIAVDRVVLRNDVPRAPVEPAVTIVPTSSRTSRTFALPECPTGCWLVQGEGFNDGWSASGLDGSPVLVDGGFNGWWIDAAAPAPRTVTLRWGGQEPVDLALIASALGVIACIVLALRGRRRERQALPDDDLRMHAWSGARIGRRRAVVVSIAGTLGALVLIGPFAAAGAAVALGIALVAARRPILVAYASLAGLCVVALYVVGQTVRLHPAPGSAFLAATSDAHQPTMLALVLLVVWTVVAAGQEPDVGPADR